MLPAQKIIVTPIINAIAALVAKAVIKEYGMVREASLAFSAAGHGQRGIVATNTRPVKK